MSESLRLAYSGLNVKSVDEDQRIITGIASTPSVDSDGDVMEPKGAQYALPIPLLWQHDKLQPIGHVIDVKATNQGIEITAKIEKISEPGPLKDRLDTAWLSLKNRLVRGLSVGWRPIEAARIAATGGLHVTKWWWGELSAVTIPANYEASIQNIKAFSQVDSAASGALHNTEEVGTPGVSGSVVRPAKKDAPTTMKTIQEQIQAFETTRQAKDTERTGLMTKAAETGTTLDAQDGTKYDDLSAEIKSIDTHLARLREAEQSNLLAAKSVDGAGVSASAAARAVAGDTGGGYARVQVRSNLPAGQEFARLVICKAAAFLSQGQVSALDIAKQRYPDNPRIQMALKAAVTAGTTLDSGYGQTISYARDLEAEFVDFLRPQTILGKLTRVTDVPFNVRYGSQTTGGTANWVGQGKPKPLTSFTFSSGTLGITKLAAIAVLADELVRVSSPSAEALVRKSLAGCVVQQMDLDLIDPGNAGTSNVKPASLTNGVSVLTSAGTSDANVITDLGKLLKPIVEAKLDPSEVTFIMPATLAMALGFLTNSLGQLVFPNIGVEGGNLRGYRVVASQQAAFTSNYGNIVVAVHEPSVLLADDGDVSIDVSREASLEMLDGSLVQDGAAGTGASLVSMWQTNMLAVRAERTVNWKKARTAAVQWMSDVNWGSIGSPA